MRKRREKKRNKRKKNTEKSGRTATYIALPQSQGFIFFFVSFFSSSSFLPYLSLFMYFGFGFVSIQIPPASFFSTFQFSHRFFFFFFFLLMERNEHLGGLFPRWPIDKRVESRTHLEITCRPFCFVFCFQISQPSRSFSTPKFRQFTTLCNSCRPAAYAHAVVDVYAVIISAFATLVDHSSAESSSGSNQYGERKM